MEHEVAATLRMMLYGFCRKKEIPGRSESQSDAHCGAI